MSCCQNTIQMVRLNATEINQIMPSAGSLGLDWYRNGQLLDNNERLWREDGYCKADHYSRWLEPQFSCVWNCCPSIKHVLLIIPWCIMSQLKHEGSNVVRPCYYRIMLKLGIYSKRLDYALSWCWNILRCSDGDHCPTEIVIFQLVERCDRVNDSHVQVALQATDREWMTSRDHLGKSRRSNIKFHLGSHSKSRTFGGILVSYL